MRVLGLTGGIGSGKSMVTQMFAQLGAAVIDADQLAREVVEPGQPALQEIAATFGPDVLLPDGRLDRKKLASVIFADRAGRAKPDAITHPRAHGGANRSPPGWPRRPDRRHPAAVREQAHQFSRESDRGLGRPADAV